MINGHIFTKVYKMIKKFRHHFLRLKLPVSSSEILSLEILARQ